MREGGREGEERRVFTILKALRTPTPIHSTTKHPAKKLCLHLQEIKAEQPDGSACQNVVRDGVIAVSSSLATEASDKL